MIIQCDQCERKFRVDDSKIKPPGSRVRCSKCGNVFFVEKKEKLITEGIRSDNIADTNQNVEPAPTAQDDSLKVSFSSMEQPVTQASEPPRESEPDLTDQGKKDFVWTVNDIEAEAKSENADIEITQSADLDIGQKHEDIEIKPATESSEQQGVTSTGSDTSPGYEWNSLEIDNEPSKEFSVSDSMPVADSGKDNDSTQFSAPSGVNGELRQESDSIEMEHKTGSDFSPPVFEEKDLELDINKQGSDDQVIPPPKEAPPADPFKSSLSVDQSTLSQIKAESYGAASPDMNDFASEPAIIKSKYVPKNKSFGSRIVSFFVSAIVGISILVIILSVFIILSINFNILPKEKTRQLRELLIATLPIKVKDPLSKIKISDVSGKWLSTLNGPLYVLSGKITNSSDNIVNYIKIKSEFTNDGELLYDKSIYAGNTFTEQELQSLPLNDILVKLNRKNGDIDFSDPRKLAGKNYNIMPGESVEFYSVFPSDNQILGLKYNIRVVDAEIVEIDQSS